MVGRLAEFRWVGIDKKKVFDVAIDKSKYKQRHGEFDHPPGGIVTTV